MSALPKIRGVHRVFIGKDHWPTVSPVVQERVERHADEQTTDYGEFVSFRFDEAKLDEVGYVLGLLAQARIPYRHRFDLEGGVA